MNSSAGPERVVSGCNFLGMKVRHTVAKLAEAVCAHMRQNPSPRRKDCSHLPKDDSVVVSNYILSFEAEHSHRRPRDHWLVCATVNSDEMVSWEYAPTRNWLN